MTLFSVRKNLGLAVLAVAFTFAITFSAFAQDYSSAEATLPSRNARPLITQKIDNSRLVALKAIVPPGMQTAVDTGRVPANMQMELRLILQRSPEQQQALNAFLAQTQTPNRALTPKDFAETFGLAKADLESVTKWLESQGFAVTKVDNVRLTILFTGSAAQVEDAFHTEIHTYRALGGEHYANATKLSMPAALDPVIRSVQGVQDFMREPVAALNGPVAPLVPAPGEESTVQQNAPSNKELNPGWTSPQGGGSILKVMHEGKTNPDVTNPTTTGVTLNPTSVIFAEGATSTVTSTISWSAVSPTPTGTLTLSDSQSIFSATINLTTCTLGTLEYTCTYTWTTPSAAGLAATDTVTAAYSGDANFSASSGTATLTITSCATCTGTIDVEGGYVITPNTVVQGQTTTQTVEVELLGTTAGGATSGSLFTWLQSPINAISTIASVTSSCSRISGHEYVCEFTWNPAATIPAGSYIVSFDYSGNAEYAGALFNGTTPFTVTPSGTTATTTTVSANPAVVTDANPSTTFTTVTTWTGAGTQPTGSIAIVPTTTSSLGGAVFPVSPATTSSGSGTYFFNEGTYTYNCTTNVTAKTVTCAIYSSYVAPLLDAGANTVTASYSGDSTYKNSSGTTTVTVSAGDSSTTSLTLTPNSVNYGGGTSVAYKATITGTTGDGRVGGTVTYTNPTLGTIGTQTLNGTNCTTSGTTGYICTLNAAVPATTAVGSYTITASYSGNATYAPSSGTATLTVAQNTSAALTAPTVNPNSVTQGSAGPVALSTTFTWTGSGANPTGAVTFLVDGTTVGTATCTGSASPLTCTYSYNPSALAAGSHSVTANYAGDTNYTGVTSNGSPLTVTAANPENTTTSVSANPTTIASSGSTLLTATVTAAAEYGTTPLSGTVTFVDTTTSATLGTSTLTISSSTAGTATLTVQGTSLAVGANTITATYNGVSGKYNTSSATTSVNVKGDIGFSSVTHNMGSVTIGNSTRYTVAVTNNTGTAIPFTAIALNTSASPNPFATQNNCGTSIPTGGCEIAFEYAPVAGDSGTQTATWSLTGVAPGTTFNPSNGGTLTGTVAPSGNVTITTAGHNFGDVTVGTTSPTYGTVITNSTNAAVTLTLGSVSSPFAGVTNCPATLGAGVSCNLQFTFSPTTTGIIQQVYSLAANGGAVPITVGGTPVTGITLTGTGD